MIPEGDRVALRPEQPTFAEAMVGKATIPPGHSWNRIPVIGTVSALLGAALYFLIWSFIALLYYRGSRGQDVTGDPEVSARLRRLAGPAIIVLALTQTFASIDWIMSLTPHWYSTMFGVYFFAGSFVGLIAILSVVAVAMRGAGRLGTLIR